MLAVMELAEMSDAIEQLKDRFKKARQSHGTPGWSSKKSSKLLSFFPIT